MLRLGVRRLLLFWLGSHVALACGESTSKPAGSGGKRDSGPEGCPVACDSAAEFQAQGQLPWECEAEALCDDVAFEAPPGFDVTAVDAVMSVESAHCALEALRDGRVGLVSWGASARSSPGVGSSKKLFVRPGRVVLSVEFQARDISTWTNYGYARLQDAPYFESCLQASEPAALFDCLERADDVACSGS